MYLPDCPDPCVDLSAPVSTGNHTVFPFLLREPPRTVRRSAPHNFAAQTTLPTVDARKSLFSLTIYTVLPTKNKPKSSLAWPQKEYRPRRNECKAWACPGELPPSPVLVLSDGGTPGLVLVRGRSTPRSCPLSCCMPGQGVPCPSTPG